MGRVLTHMKTSLSVSFTLLMSVAAVAQNDPPGRVARLNLSRGAVSMLSQATGPDWVPAQINFPLTTGDQVWTDFDGRAELHIGTAAIRLREETSATFTLLDDRTVQFQLVAGGLNVHVRHLYDDEVFEIDTPNLAFTIRKPGDYRIDVEGQQTKVIVWSGAGEVYGEGRDFPLRARDFATVSGYGQLAYTLMSAPAPDDFDRWAQDRDRRQQQSQSARYVASETIGAEDLDLYGSWSEMPDIGPVWTPRVNGGWAPYTIGHWAWIEPWGWTWIDDSPWGFAPFHYGRWMSIGGAWAWVPGPRGQRSWYSPALVAWCGGGGGRSAWFALGPGEVYVPSHRSSIDYVTRVNISNTTVNRTVIQNVYANRTNITYVNQGVTGAVVGMSHTDMAAGRRNTLPVTTRPQVTGVAPVPTSRPLMQPMPRGGGAVVARPPAAVVSPARPVVMRNQVPGTARPAPSRLDTVPSAESGRRFPARESETVRPPQPRTENPPERPRRQPSTESDPVPLPRPTERVERPVERERQPRTDRPTERVEQRPVERIERPAQERPQPRVERPVERVERPVPPPERVNRPEIRIERPVERIERPAPQPHPENRPEVRPEPRREEPKREERKEEKKKDDKKQ